MPNKTLTEKQERFCQKYIELKDASAAYRASYNAENMKDTTIHVRACELLKNSKVAVRLEELQAHHFKRHEITVDNILSELGKIGFSDIRNIVKWGDSVAVKNEDGEIEFAHGVGLKGSDEIDDQIAGAIAEVSQTKDGLKVKLYDKQSALVNMGKHLGMFPSNHKHEVSGPDGKPIAVENTGSIEQARRIAFALGRAHERKVLEDNTIDVNANNE